MSVYGEWKDAVITIATDDDLTPEVDLGRDYEFLDIVIPTITSAEISLEVADKTGGTFQALGDGISTDATTGGYTTVFNLYGFQFIKVKTSAAQAANRTFKVRGWRR